MLPDSLVCPFLIAPSVFSNVHIIAVNSQNKYHFFGLLLFQALADIPENANSTHACFFPVGQAVCYSTWAQCKRSNCRALCQWHFVNTNHTSCEPIISG